MTLRTACLALLVAAGAAALALPATAQQQRLVALSGDRTLVTISGVLPRVTMQVNAAVPGCIVGIDVRPRDGKLYALLANGAVVTLNPATDNVIDRMPSLSQAVPPTFRTVDFNPAADRLRLVGTDGTNLSVNVDDGTVTPQTTIAFVPPNPFGGTAPRVVAGAYTNSRSGALSTLLYDVDDATQALYVQNPPAIGTLFPVGRLRLDPGAVAFDIRALAGGQTTAFLINGNRLFQVDLGSGTALNGRRIQGLRGPVRDVASIPSSWRNRSTARAGSRRNPVSRRARRAPPRPTGLPEAA